MRRTVILAALAMTQAIGVVKSVQSNTNLVQKETFIVSLQPEPAHAMTTQADYLPWGYHLDWSPDMKRVVYWVTTGDDLFLVVNGVPGRTFDIIDDGSPRGGLVPPDVFFTPDSRHFRYQARRGRKWFMVRDGKESKGYDEIRDTRFSSDGRHFAYNASRDHQLFLVVNCVEAEKSYSEAIGAVLPPLIFDGPNTLHTLALRDRKVYRVEIEVTER